MRTFICNNLNNCLVYQNWIEQTKKDRLDIIYFAQDDEEYKCLALDSLNDAETGIFKNKELTNRLKNEGCDCAFIESLNNQLKIFRKLEELIR